MGFDEAADIGLEEDLRERPTNDGLGAVAYLGNAAHKFTPRQASQIFFMKGIAMSVRAARLFVVGLLSVLCQSPFAKADLITGLTAHWPLNEAGSSTSAADLVAGNDAALLGAGAQFVADGTRGQVLEVNGTSTGAAVAALNPVNLDAGTILGWVMLSDTVPADGAGHHFFPGHSRPGGNRIYFYSAGRDLKIGMGNSGAIGSTTAPSFDAGWHQVALTWTASAPGSGSGSFTAYYDGTQVQTNNYTGLNTPATWFSIGANYDPGDPAPHTSSFWNGRISDIGVWNRPLSGAEVAEIFALGTIPIPEPTSLVVAVSGGVALLLRRRKIAQFVL